MRQIDVVKPRVIVALGATAAKNLLAMNDSMANLRGRWYDFRGTKLIVTYHPAYLLRDPRQKKETWKDLQMVMKFLGLKPPRSRLRLNFVTALQSHLRANLVATVCRRLMKRARRAASLAVAVSLSPCPIAPGPLRLSDLLTFAC